MRILSSFRSRIAAISCEYVSDDEGLLANLTSEFKRPFLRWRLTVAIAARERERERERERDEI